MNKTIEAIRNGQEVTTEELFELVNIYELTTLSLMKDGKKNASLDVNRFTNINGAYEFSQGVDGDTTYIINPKEIISVSSEWNDDANSIVIWVDLIERRKLSLIVWHPESNCKTEVLKAVEETDLYELKDFLEEALNDDSPWDYMLINVSDNYGMRLKMKNPTRIYIDDYEDGEKLYINDDTNEFEIDVDEGMVVYTKNKEDRREYWITPSGHPFMEIYMVFFKN